MTSKFPKLEKPVGADGKKRSRNRVSDLEDEVAENMRREAEEVRRTLVDPIKKYRTTRA